MLASLALLVGAFVVMEKSLSLLTPPLGVLANYLSRACSTSSFTLTLPLCALVTIRAFLRPSQVQNGEAGSLMRDSAPFCAPKKAKTCIGTTTQAYPQPHGPSALPLLVRQYKKRRLRRCRLPAPRVPNQVLHPSAPPQHNTHQAQEQNPGLLLRRLHPHPASSDTRHHDAQGGGVEHVSTHNNGTLGPAGFRQGRVVGSEGKEHDISNSA